MLPVLHLRPALLVVAAADYEALTLGMGLLLNSFQVKMARGES
jgi:hypothetical protein